MCTRSSHDVSTMELAYFLSGGLISGATGLGVMSSPRRRDDERRKGVEARDDERRRIVGTSASGIAELRQLLLCGKEEGGHKQKKKIYLHIYRTSLILTTECIVGPSGSDVECLR